MNSSTEESSPQGDRQAENILEFEGDIHPETTIPNNRTILVTSKDQSYLTHGIHKFPAKFFPELPRFLIQKYSDAGMKILDPMCGSGTVLLEAMLYNRIGIGLDIDPIARLISKVKTTPLPPSQLNSISTDLKECIQQKIQNDSYSPSIPSFHYRDRWFRGFVLYELGTIFDSINDMLENTSRYIPECKDFLHVVFSSIIRDVSNADPHCTRTVIRKNQLRRIHPGDTIHLFFESLEKQTKGLLELWEFSQEFDVEQVHVPLATATHIPLSGDSIDLAITSPPYINAVDYTRTHQLEMYWLQMLGQGPLSDTKRKYIGTETVYKKEYQNLQVSGYNTLDPLLQSIYELDPRRSFIVFKFFEDMKSQLLDTFRVLKPGSKYCLVIGNNTIRGLEVNSHEIICEIATSSEIGFKLEKKFFSLLIRHFIRIPRPERMDGEWVLVLKKPE